MKAKQSLLNRRRFLRDAATAVGGAVALPWLAPASALGAGGRAAPSERIVMGVIGQGGRGRYDLGAFMNNPDVQMVAVCDARRERRELGRKAVNEKYGNTDCAVYRSYEDLLARPDLDAVLIATGDNNHSHVAIAAARAGLDMYCEKPMSVAITEGRAVCDAMKRFGRIFQCGTQRRSIARFRFAVDLARNGRLGKLTTLYAEKAPMAVEWTFQNLPAQPEPPKEEFDWDEWLGPAQWRPYNAKYATRGFWSNNLDFSGGAINEWGSHTADLCQWANHADGTGPVEFEPWQGTVVAHYRNGVKLIFEKGKWPLHVRFVGTKGMVYVDDDGNLETDPPSLRANRNFGKGYPAENQVRIFLDCVKSRQQPTSPAETAHRSITVGHIANIVRFLNRPLKWNPDREEFVGDEQANRMRSRAIREPWII
jgi:predicted dehydrogenase